MGIKEALELGRRASVGINPADIVLTRTTTTKSATTGGPVTSTALLPAQRVRLVKPRPGVDPEQVTVGAKATKVDWLVMFIDAAADVQNGDKFDHPSTGKPCTVIGTQGTSAEGAAVLVTALASEVR